MTAAGTDQYGSREELCSKLQDAYPTLPKVWAEAIASQDCDEVQTESLFGRIVRCNRFDGPRLVLLGDAAHAVTSSLGQGCSTALESVRVFNAALDASGKWDVA